MKFLLKLMFLPVYSVVYVVKLLFELIAVMLGWGVLKKIFKD